VAKRRRSYDRRAGRHAEQPYPLVHLAVCVECGSNIVGATLNIQNGKKVDPPRYYMRCKKDRAVCDSRRMAAEMIEGQVWVVLDQFRATLRDATRRDPQASLPAPRPLPEPRAVDAIRAEMERLGVMYQKGRITEERYDREYAALEERLVAASATITSIGTPDDPMGLLAVENMMDGFDAAWKQNDRAKLREIARTMIERVEVYRGVVMRVRLVPELELLAELE
jgi:ribosomal protein L32